MPQRLPRLYAGWSVLGHSDLPNGLLLGLRHCPGALRAKLPREADSTTPFRASARTARTTKARRPARPVFAGQQPETIAAARRRCSELAWPTLWRRNAGRRVCVSMDRGRRDQQGAAGVCSRGSGRVRATALAPETRHHACLLPQSITQRLHRVGLHHELLIHGNELCRATLHELRELWEKKLFESGCLNHEEDAPATTAAREG